jgi:CO/xanthine dehydrogenase Mo-binding subunit
VLKQIAAEELGIRRNRMMGDTSVVPFDSSTSASRSTVFMGNAIVKACRDVKLKLKPAARTFSVRESDVRVGDGLVSMADHEIGYAELLEAHFGPPRGGHRAGSREQRLRPCAPAGRASGLLGMMAPPRR